MIKTMLYDSTEDIEQAMELNPMMDETLTTIENNKVLKADLMTSTKSLKVALNRFFKNLPNNELFDGWRDCMEESIEVNMWTGKEVGSWSWGVEQYGEDEDNTTAYYIYLNIVK